MTPAPAQVPSQPTTREVRGDIGAAGGDVAHHGNLKVGGTIRDGMKVDVEGDLTVGGSIETANVTASGSITVASGIVGRGKSHCTSGGSITFHLANGVTLDAGGDVTAGVEIVSCRIMTSGVLKCEKAQISGGHITANAGVICGVLGNASGTPTLIEAGLDERLRIFSRTRAEEISRNLKKITTVRSQIAPLLSCKQVLTAKQKETATELLYNASELEDKTKWLVKDLHEVVQTVQSRSKPEITVLNTVYPGTLIRLRGYETQITDALAGPLRLSLKSAGNLCCIVVTNLSDNKMLPLKTTIYHDKDQIAMNQAVQPMKMVA